MITPKISYLGQPLILYKYVPIRLLAPVIAILIGLTNLSVARAAEAEICNALPDVAWWVNAPEKINNLVETRYKGDWEPYLASWQRYHDSMELSLETGAARVIKSRGITLRGPSLAVFVFNIKKRIEVLDCFARNSQAAESLGGFATAAGDPVGVARRSTTVLSSCDQLPQVDWWSKTPAASVAQWPKNSTAIGTATSPAGAAITEA